MVKVKICGITRPEDALCAAEAGADAIGLNFCARSPRCVDVATAAEIVAALPAGVCRVGVFVDAPRPFVAETVERLHLDALQFHGDESIDDCRGWPQKVIKAVRVRDAESVARVLSFPVAFVLADAWVDGVAGGTGRLARWDLLADVDRGRLILAGGLSPENVAEAIRRVRPAAVDVASGVESSPGKKDPEKVRRFIAHAQSA